MFHAFLVEIGAHAVGVVAQESDGYRFFAIKPAFRDLENQVFDSAENARNAALDLHAPADRSLSALTSLGA